MKTVILFLPLFICPGQRIAPATNDRISQKAFFIMGNVLMSTFGHVFNRVAVALRFRENAVANGAQSPNGATIQFFTEALKPNNNIARIETRSRTYQTPTDLHFQQNKSLPLPSVLHCVLPPPSPDVTPEERRVLVIGDVHGCLEELQDLVTKASALLRTLTKEEVCKKDLNFYAVVLAGDLVNKGPESLGVLRYVQSKMKANDNSKEERNTRWYCIRGNHDNGALEVAIDRQSTKRLKGKYSWVCDENSDKSSGRTNFLIDNDIKFLSDLPYTISIPWLTNKNEDLGKAFEEGSTESMNGEVEIDGGLKVVHAGLVPGVPLSKQEIYDLITLRDVVHVGDGCYASASCLEIKEKRNVIAQDLSSSSSPPPSRRQSANQLENDNHNGPKKLPWAEVWNGPETVIFGHDAKRELQLHLRSSKGESAAINRALEESSIAKLSWNVREYSTIGLDTGAVYGKKLTGIILPDGILVSVPSKRVYQSIKAAN